LITEPEVSLNKRDCREPEYQGHGRVVSVLPTRDWREPEYWRETEERLKRAWILKRDWRQTEESLNTEERLKRDWRA
jgi:hypothetical protein